MTGNNKRAAIDWFDRKVLHYVLFWAPAGGMDDEDVFPEFGMRLVGRSNFRQVKEPVAPLGNAINTKGSASKPGNPYSPPVSCFEARPHLMLASAKGEASSLEIRGGTELLKALA